VVKINKRTSHCQVVWQVRVAFSGRNKVTHLRMSKNLQNL